MSWRIKNWDQFQHYKTGKNAAKRPEWIRLYTRLLDDIEFHELSGDDTKALVMLWALASERDGDLPSEKAIAFRLRLPEQKVRQILGRLSHWVEGSSYNNPRTEEKREEEKREEKIERESRASALPSDWEPSSENQKNLSQYPTPVLREELEKFRDHFTANGKRMKDWDAAFRNWMRRRQEFQRAPPRQTREERFRAVVAEHLEEIDSRANIVELRTGRRELRGPDSECRAGELHATATGRENHAPLAYDPLHGEAEVSFDEDGSP